MVFGRIVREPNLPARCELVLQDAPQRKRVLFRETIEGDSPSADEFRDMEPLWSPDDRTIVVPSFKRPGLTLIRGQNGQILRFLEGASHPSWSPEDAKLAFFRGKLSTELLILDGTGMEPRRLAEVLPDRENLPGPFWSRDGQSLSYLRKAAAGGAQAGRFEVLRLSRVRADTGQSDSAIDLIHDPIPKDAELKGAWFASDPNGDAVVYATLSSSQKTSQFSWCPARPNEVHKRLNPLDASVSMGALAMEPGGRSLALRFRKNGQWSPPAICDLASERLICVASDDETRKQWLTLILDLLRSALRDGVAPATLADGTPVSRPSVLPIPGELESGDLTALKLRRLARIGLPLMDPSSSVEAIETRLVLAYFSEVYDSALGAVDLLTARAEDSAHRRKLLGLRAQILLAKRDLATARPLIDHLRRSAFKPIFEVQEDILRTSLIPISDPRASWPDLLSESLEKLLKPAPDSELEIGEDEDPLERKLREQDVMVPGRRAIPGNQPF